MLALLVLLVSMVGANALHFFGLLPFFSPLSNVFKTGTFLPVRCLCLTLASLYLKMIYGGTGTHAMFETGEGGRADGGKERDRDRKGVASGT